MHLDFTKMHGIGNDFIVINALRQPFDLSGADISALAHRRFGVGFDQLLVVEPSTNSEAEFNYRIFNANGGEVENCGNGARCFARYVVDKGLTDSSEIPVHTSAGLMHLVIEDDQRVTVRMGAPVFEPDKVPFIAPAMEDSYRIEVAEKSFDVGVVAVGNPHVVTCVEDVAKTDVDRLGPAFEGHERFPNRVNAGFMQVLGRDEIRLRVFERGVGETMACGTGACAAVVVGITQGLLDTQVLVHLGGGDLEVKWTNRKAQVMMTGPCETVFEGRLEK